MEKNMLFISFFSLTNLKHLITKHIRPTQVPVHPKKVLASFIAMIFVLQQVVFAAAGRAPIFQDSPKVQAITPTEIAPIIKNPSHFTTPHNFFSLDSYHQGSNGKLLIRIQDPHANYSGQMNIAKGLGQIIMRYPDIETILVEGGYQDATLSHLRDIVPLKIWQRKSKGLLMDNHIDGIEYLNLTTELPMRLIGIEEKSLYHQNLEAFGYLKEYRSEALAFIRKVQLAIQKLKHKHYPEQLLEYEKINTEDDFIKSLKTLSVLAQEQGVRTSNYRQFSALQKILTVESSIDFEALQKEGIDLLSKVSEQSGDLKTLFEDASNWAGNIYMAYDQVGHILSIIEANDLPNDEYLNYMEYHRYLASLTELNMEELFEEKIVLENAVYEAYLGDRDSILLRDVDQYIKYLDKAYRIQLSSDEYELLSASHKDFPTIPWQAFINARLEVHGFYQSMIPSSDVLERANDYLQNFYSVVNERDLAFVQNSNAYLDQESQNVAVMVTGGYHTKQLTKLLEEEGYSYVVLTPHVDFSTDHKHYETLLETALSESKSSTLDPPSAYLRAASRLALANVGGVSNREQIMNAFEEMLEALPTSAIAASRLSWEPWGGDKEQALDALHRVNARFEKELESDPLLNDHVIRLLKEMEDDRQMRASPGYIKSTQIGVLQNLIFPTIRRYGEDELIDEGIWREFRLFQRFEFIWKNKNLEEIGEIGDSKSEIEIHPVLQAMLDETEDYRENARAVEESIDYSRINSLITKLADLYLVAFSPNSETSLEGVEFLHGSITFRVEHYGELKMTGMDHDLEADIDIWVDGDPQSDSQIGWLFNADAYGHAREFIEAVSELALIHIDRNYSQINDPDVMLTPRQATDMGSGLVEGLNRLIENSITSAFETVPPNVRSRIEIVRNEVEVMQLDFIQEVERFDSDITETPPSRLDRNASRLATLEDYVQYILVDQEPLQAARDLISTTDEEELKLKIVKLANILNGQVQENLGSQGVIADFYKGLIRDSRLIFDVDIAKKIQILAGQALTKLYWMTSQDVIPPDESDNHFKLEYFASSEVKHPNPKKYLYGSFFQDSTSPTGLASEEGQPGYFYRGAEGLEKLGDGLMPQLRFGDDYSTREQGLRDYTQALYVMNHGHVEVPEGLRDSTGQGERPISTFHDTFFVTDHVRESLQVTSTGAGHFQGTNMDIKYVTEGYGVQLNTLYGRNGEVLEVRAQYLAPGTWAVALPGYVDSVINFGELRFNDVSIELTEYEAGQVLKNRGWEKEVNFSKPPTPKTTHVGISTSAIGENGKPIANKPHLVPVGNPPSIVWEEVPESIIKAIGKPDLLSFYRSADSEGFSGEFNNAIESLAHELSKPLDSSDNRVRSTSMMAASARARQIASLRGQSLQVRPYFNRQAWGGTANANLVADATPDESGVPVSEVWYGSVQTDGLSTIVGTTVHNYAEVTLLELTKHFPESLGDHPDKPMFTKFLDSRFADVKGSAKVHMGFNDKIAAPDGQETFIGLLEEERKLLWELKGFIRKGMSAQSRRKIFAAFKSDYEAWVDHQAQRKWSDSSHLINSSSWRKSGKTTNEAELNKLIEKMRATRAEIVSYINEIELEPGQFILSSVGHPHAIFGLSHQTHPLVGEPKNEAWYVIEAGPDNVVLVEPQQTSNTTYSFADFYTPFKVDGSGNVDMRKNLAEDKEAQGEVRIAQELQTIRGFVEDGLHGIPTTAEDFIIEPTVLKDEAGVLHRVLVDGTRDPERKVWPLEYFVSESISLEEGASIRLAPHERVEEELIVTEGSVEVLVGGPGATFKEMVLNQGESLFIPAQHDAKYTINALGKSEVLRFHVPAETYSVDNRLSASRLSLFSGLADFLPLGDGVLANPRLEALSDSGLFALAIENENSAILVEDIPSSASRVASILPQGSRFAENESDWTDEEFVIYEAMLEESIQNLLQFLSQQSAPVSGNSYTVFMDNAVFGQGTLSQMVFNRIARAIDGLDQYHVVVDENQLEGVNQEELIVIANDLKTSAGSNSPLSILQSMLTVGISYEDASMLDRTAYVDVPALMSLIFRAAFGQDDMSGLYADYMHVTGEELTREAMNRMREYRYLFVRPKINLLSIDQIMQLHQFMKDTEVFA